MAEGETLKPRWVRLLIVSVYNNYDTVASSATVYGTLSSEKYMNVFIGHWLIWQVGSSNGLQFGLLLLESSISRLFMYVDVLFISIYSISLDSSDYKVVSTLLMFTNSYM